MYHKRAYDLLVILFAHLALFPVWIILWVVIPIAIWMEDRGPVLFRQQRIGKDGNSFSLYKFRTMVANAEIDGLATAHEDPRITNVGRVLRRTALDELPQIINILKGDMSFVGPRALPIAMHNEATTEEPRFPERLKVSPGLTGVAQSYLPRHCSPRKRLMYDIIYIKKVSIWLDMRLMLIAVLATITGTWGTGKRTSEISKEKDFTSLRGN